VYTELLQTQTKENTEAEQLLYEACNTALRQGLSAETETISFDTEQARENAIDAFFDTMATGKDLKGASKEQIYYYIPCIFLIDNDGYFIAYSTTYTDSDGATMNNQIITERGTWSIQYGNYTVRYFLNDVVAVTDVNGYESEGSPEDVYSDLGRPATLSFLNSQTEFKAAKESVIRDITNEKVNYYINTHNTYYNKLEQSYEFSMPEIDSAIDRMMDAPSVMSFYQGKQIAHTKGYINVFALSGSIETEKKSYYLKEVSGTLYYHESGCAYLTASDYKKGLKMEDCAKAQAYACPDCYR
jgi:hypothetical protein